MVLEMARAAMERRDELKREQDRLEEGQQDEERRVGKWVNHDGSPEEETLDELYLHDTLPVAPERNRLLVSLKMTSKVQAAIKAYGKYRENFLVFSFKYISEQDIDNSHRY